MTEPKLVHRDEDASDDESAVGEHDEAALPMTQEEREEIAKKENRAVACFRLIVLLVLAVSCALVTFGVHYYMTDNETSEFEDQFHSDANKAAKLLRLSKGYQVGVSQNVLPDQKDDWEAYAVANLDWIHQAFDVMEDDEDWKHPVNREFQTMPIFGFNGPVAEPASWSAPNGTGAYGPSWTQYPVVPESFFGFPYNFDGWQVPSVAETCRNAYENKKVTLSSQWTGIITDPDDPVQVQTVEAFWAFARLFVPHGYIVEEPAGLAIIPMYDTLESIRVDTTQDLEPVAYMTFSFFIKELLKDILPESSRRLHVVIDSACGVNHTVTYQLDGRETTFLGAADLHESQYNHLEYKATFGQMMDITQSGRASSHYTGLPLDDTFCTKSFRIYPSQIMEQEYRSSTPVTTAIIAAGVFVFTTVVFLIYDFTVARRQKIVLGRALASGAIVNSLFPEKVRQQLYEERQAEQAQIKSTNEFRSSNVSRTIDGVADAAASRPIAHLYDNTTIFFADIVGFTRWSSTRSPVEVFELLETLYGAFDVVAKRRNIYKVETIGDCYVAAAGLPEEQEDHAVRMIKFARDCRLVMSQKLDQLVDTLGADTADLGMRVGCHSGSTTAGVLRGERGRYQLFGDTVNTAARMESNGVPGKIHVSMATFQALKAEGKGHWCVPRPDKIHAKGKGEMQTYFVELSQISQSATRSAMQTSVAESRDVANDDLAEIAEEQFEEEPEDLSQGNISV
ncbi:Receptor-type guanylate cyclase gcy [Seminavis robusta]|uniref:Receptor-type guanylate cyclase gcy n=1 Tax=Seminavis robusta TaxID=568900 RepID=A0A9N8EAI8_9STRA|nr:Receptor-type guanylate cyclase gcy [Seminavis robusta]|eukprot:Sro729_g193860.1 Receptor-type guanylate cyclase gcy (736) ;mRNA; f:31168-33787